MPDRVLAVVGVGLIGGSVAAAARQRGVVSAVHGIDPNPEHLRIGTALGFLTSTAAAPGAELATADLVVVSAPVPALAQTIAEVLGFVAPTAVVTDVGSTKAHVVDELARQPRAGQFVGGHPLAGSEKAGPAHARADLFQGKLVILTPTAKTVPATLARTVEFWQALGARTAILDPLAHDETLAFTSHLPNVVSFALAGQTPPTMLPYTASGFRDMTRLAGSDPELWAGILLTNRRWVRLALEQLQARLADFAAALTEGEPAALLTLLREGWAVRHALGSGDPPPAS